MKRLLLAVVVIVTSFGYGFSENTVAVKTNILYDALLNANLGVEVQVAPRWTIDLSGNYNGWTLSNGKKWKHWMVQPEARYWLLEPAKGHFFTVHALGGQFNTNLFNMTKRHQGYGYGAGIGYGYSWKFSKHWGLEAEIAAGYVRLNYDEFPCTDCGRKLASRTRNYIGPTKAAVNLVYYFGKTKRPVLERPVPNVPQIVLPPPAMELPEFKFRLVDVPHSRVRTENLTGVARVQFALNKTNIDPTLGNNAAELGGILAKLDSISDDLGMQVVSISFSGFASPEGSYSNNERLALGRTAALRTYIRNERTLADSVISVRSTPEDWAGLRRAVIASDLEDKDALLAIIDGSQSPDAKEAALRKHKNSWAYMMQNILPDLRRTEYEIVYEHRYEEKETRTLEAVNRAIEAGDLDLALDLLVDIPSSPEADYASGVIAALKGYYTEARGWFLRAKKRGIEAADDALFQVRKHL